MKMKKKKKRTQSHRHIMLLDIVTENIEFMVLIGNSIVYLVENSTATEIYSSIAP